MLQCNKPADFGYTSVCSNNMAHVNQISSGRAMLIPGNGIIRNTITH